MFFQVLKLGAGWSTHTIYLVVALARLVGEELPVVAGLLAGVWQREWEPNTERKVDDPAKSKNQKRGKKASAIPSTHTTQTIKLVSALHNST